MPRHKKSAPAFAPEVLLQRKSEDERHAEHIAYAALMARLDAFHAEITSQSRSRPAAEAPATAVAQAADLMAQIARLIGPRIERRGLPRLDAGAPTSFSQTALAFVQARSAFETFGKRLGYDEPVADAQKRLQYERLRRDVFHTLNDRIVRGIRTGYLVPFGDELDEEKRELSIQFKAIVERLGLIADPECFEPPCFNVDE